MTSPAFSELVSRLIQAMGQQMNAVRDIPEGLLLKTDDGFVYAFLEDPTRVSLNDIQRLLGEAGPTPAKLAILTPGHLPLALTQAVLQRNGAVIEHARFQELARGLGLGEYLGDEPRAPAPPVRGRLLPSAQQLDAIMHRARSWLDWGVPALSLRFYRQAAGLKPEFTPARVGIGRSLLALQLTEDADRTFDEILGAHPDDLDARLGKAAVLGSRGRVEEEVRVYRELLQEEPSRADVRAHLLAALVAEKSWKEALREVEQMVRATPEDPRVRFLHAAMLLKTGEAAKGERERRESRALGLTFEQERALCEYVGLPAPERPVEERAPTPTAAPPSAPRTARAAPRARRSTPSKTRRKAK